MENNNKILWETSINTVIQNHEIRLPFWVTKFLLLRPVFTFSKLPILRYPNDKISNRSQNTHVDKDYNYFFRMNFPPTKNRHFSLIIHHPSAFSGSWTALMLNINLLNYDVWTIRNLFGFVGTIVCFRSQETQTLLYFPLFFPSKSAALH